jgi:hypothetical protein
MKCWHCDSDAKAVCVFCGRAICAEHRKSNAYFIGYGKKHADALLSSATTTAADIQDASWCGVCTIVYFDTY